MYSRFTLFLNRQSDLEVRLARTRISPDISAMLINDPVHGVESETGALANGLGGIERIENPILDLRGDTRPVIDDVNQSEAILTRSAHSEFAFAGLRLILESKDRVV